MVRVIRQGRWLYGGTVERRVQIVAQDWDYYHEPEIDCDPPELNDEGEAFYFVVVSETGDHDGRSNTFLSLSDVLAHACTYGVVDWDDPDTE